jgi:cell division protein FtsQ
MFGSRRFTLERIEVVGNSRVPASWVRDMAAAELGANLLLLPLTPPMRRLEAHPWIAHVEIRKQLPDTLVVQVHERKPAALLRRGEELAYVGADGTVILRAAAEEVGAENLLRLVASTEIDLDGTEVRAALSAARELERARPQWAAKLREVEILGPDEMRLSTDALPFPLLVRAETLAASVRRLQDLLPEIEARYPHIDAVDLRAVDRIVIRPGGEIPEQPESAT